MGNNPYLKNEQVARAAKLDYYDMTEFAQQAVDERLDRLEAEKAEKIKRGKEKGEKE